MFLWFIACSEVVGMSLTSRTVRGLTAAVSLLLWQSGCSDFESSFVYSERTQSLITEAQNGMKSKSKDDSGDEAVMPGVKKLVDDRFGSPQHLNAWLKLPIDFGGTAGTIGEVGENNTVVLAFDEASGGSPKAVEMIQILSGDCAGEVVSVSAWNAVTSTATLTTALKAAPKSGDSIVTGGGEVLKNGRSLYQRHCSHCHGTSGDGNGPTAQYLYPRPRDYRHGVFKFTTTNDQSKASREDLARILKQGIAGTYMPSFLLLPDSEIHSLVEYVRFLAMRGEFERRLVNELASDYSQTAVTGRIKGGEKRADILKDLSEFLASDFPDSVTTTGDELAEAWTAADTEDAKVIPSVARVPDSPESRRRGRELYLSKALNCADCHGIYGQGNGPQTTIFEKNPVTNELYPEPGLHDVWDNVNQPRNLTYGIYRGGRRPVDLFGRIHAGIKGSRMPSFKNQPHEDIWHIVNYVLSIPFEVEPGAAAKPAQTAAVTVP